MRPYGIARYKQRVVRPWPMPPKIRLMTARSETASLDDQEIRFLRSKRLGLPFTLILIVDAMMVGGVVYASVASSDFLDVWTVAALLPVALLLALITLNAEAEWRFLRKDLRAGTKVFRGGRIASLSTRDDGESPTIYRIGITADDPESPIGFSVPQEVYDAVEEGQMVRVAYAPLSRVLLELKTGTCAYRAASTKHGKNGNPAHRTGRSGAGALNALSME
jgi:hypothetical protein